MNSAIRKAATLVFFLPSMALAQEPDGPAFSTALDINYKQLKVQSTSSSAGLPNATYKPNLWSIAFSPSVSYRGAFLSLVLDKSIGDGSYSSIQDNPGHAPGGGSVGVSTGPVWSDSRFTRYESSLTAGYSFWKGLTGFFGYLKNSTEWYETDLYTGPFTLQFAGKTTYRESGPYGGLAYSQPLRERTALSGSVAYAHAHGSETSQSIPLSGGALQSPTYTTGGVKGFSYALNLTGPLAGAVHYKLGGRITRYEFAAGGSTTKQDYNAVTIGVVDYF